MEYSTTVAVSEMTVNKFKKFDPKIRDVSRAGLHWRFGMVVDHYGGIDNFCQQFFLSRDYIIQHLAEGYPAPVAVACLMGEQLLATNEGFSPEFLRPDIKWRNLVPTSKTKEVRHYKQEIMNQRSSVYDKRKFSLFGGLNKRDRQTLFDWLAWDLGRELPKKWG